ncbi:MAG: hypothetical protein HXX15_10675 [Rhodopseudomonas sp.]|uniref:hypothetical protein n=1 Tax=Rhodopseudomonas sp. TaxID=1078 RepID=UPI0018224ECD|nr:hypothetical protein [Rhodopseudomonas sp.]NVN86539.1 hypothetical protein [Rhodopseudomonas sp.]
MRAWLILGAMLVSATALAQSPPPMVGDKPLVQIKPKQAKPAGAAIKQPGKPQSIAVRLQACLDIEDGSKERLDCYDAVFPPKAKPGAKPPKAAAKAVADCRLQPEQDERLACFNGFADSIPKLPR